MRLSPQQLTERGAQALAPVYLVFGDEPLLIDEAADHIRAMARAQGCSERRVFTVEPGFDWQVLGEAQNALSLFAERRLLEVRLGDAKPGEAGAKALIAYTRQPPAEDVLLITAGKLDRKSQQSKWFQALEQAGAVVQARALPAQQLPRWIEGRMGRYGLKPNAQAVSLLAARVEGNLLACAQEIDKLYLLYGAASVGAEEVADSVADSARFSVYDLVDQALAGEAGQAARILRVLQAEGTEGALVLWALAREIRALAPMAREVAAGSQVQAVLSRYQVWDRRKGLVQKALRRHSGVAWQQLLSRAARVDRVVKGAAAGNKWDELLQLVLTLAGAAAVEWMPAGASHDRH